MTTEGSIYSCTGHPLAENARALGRGRSVICDLTVCGGSLIEVGEHSAGRFHRLLKQTVHADKTTEKASLSDRRTRLPFLKSCTMQEHKDNNLAHLLDPLLDDLVSTLITIPNDGNVWTGTSV